MLLTGRQGRLELDNAKQTKKAIGWASCLSDCFLGRRLLSQRMTRKTSPRTELTQDGSYDLRLCLLD